MEYWWVGCEDCVLVCSTGSLRRLSSTGTTTIFACEIGSDRTICSAEAEEVPAWLEMCSKETEYNKR
eukprot:1158695-Prorocentrum_lima.AAC.1